eukprot:TRINITY_DN4990_c0_g1_i1.p1 TRINITY_DN4990_c0_g1~~TRINITY_DN4990_c0_g1_i1.p1  ORF type:complete len:735 (+),score=153.60 TRINITY_DN4990_c0_g1_i1:77-2206(+)
MVQLGDREVALLKEVFTALGGPTSREKIAQALSSVPEITAATIAESLMRAPADASGNVGFAGFMMVVEQACSAMGQDAFHDAFGHLRDQMPTTPREEKKKSRLKAAGAAVATGVRLSRTAAELKETPEEKEIRLLKREIADALKRLDQSETISKEMHEANAKLQAENKQLLQRMEMSESVHSSAQSAEAERSRLKEKQTTERIKQLEAECNDLMRQLSSGGGVAKNQQSDTSLTSGPIRAERALQLELELLRVQLTEVEAEHQKALAAERNRADTQQKKATELLQQLRTAQLTLEEVRNRQQTECSNCVANKQTVAAAREKMDAMQAQYERQVTGLKDKVSGLQSELVNAQYDLQLLGNSSELMEELKNLRLYKDLHKQSVCNNCDIYKRQLAAQSRQFAEVMKQLEELKADTSKDVEIRNLWKECNELRKDCEEKTAKLSDMETEIQFRKQYRCLNCDTLRRQMEAMKHELTAKIADAEGKNPRSERERLDLREDVANLQERLTEALRGRQEAVRRTAALEQDLALMKATVEKLQKAPPQLPPPANEPVVPLAVEHTTVPRTRSLQQADASSRTRASQRAAVHHERGDAPSPPPAATGPPLGMNESEWEAELAAAYVESRSGSPLTPPDSRIRYPNFAAEEATSGDLLGRIRSYEPSQDSRASNRVSAAPAPSRTRPSRGTEKQNLRFDYSKRAWVGTSPARPKTARR